MTDNKERKPADNSSNDDKDKDYQNLDFTNFDDFLFEYHNGELIKGIYSYGFEKPSPIQSKAIMPICDGRDVIAQAKSGSGKTGAFVIGALTRINIDNKFVQVVILANTRELALQIYHVLVNIGLFVKMKVCLCVGGNVDTMSNLNDAYESHVLICTPGRLYGLIEKDTYNKKTKIKLLDRLKILIIDEADMLLGRNFIDQIKNIINNVPKETQICLFSATYSEATLELTTKFMTRPVSILVESEKISVEAIKNYYIDVERNDYKYETLIELYQKVSVCQAVIFVNSVETAIEISNRLNRDGYPIGVIHSKLDDVQRLDIMKKFRLTQTRILIATDLISRGIDVQQVGLVINYDVPSRSEQYIHRVGRSGRYGKIGVAITFCTHDKIDTYRMKDIERDYNIKFSELPVLDEINNYLTGLNGFKIC